MKKNKISFISIIKNIILFIIAIGLLAIFVSLFLLFLAWLSGERPTFESFMLRIDAVCGFYLILLLGMNLNSLFSTCIEKITFKLFEREVYELGEFWMMLFGALLLSVSVFLSYLILVTILWNKPVSYYGFQNLFYSTFYNKALEAHLDFLLITDAYENVKSLIIRYNTGKIQAILIYLLGILSIIANIEGGISFFERITGKKNSA